MSLAGVALLGLVLMQDGPHQASGVKVGEVTQSSAIVWARLTRRTRSVPLPTRSVFSSSLSRKGKRWAEAAMSKTGQRSTSSDNVATLSIISVSDSSEKLAVATLLPATS